MQPFYHRSGSTTIRKIASLSDGLDVALTVVVEHRSNNAAEHGSSADIAHGFGPVVRKIRLERMRQVHQRKSLQPHASRSGECGEEDAVSAKEHIADALNACDVEADARLEGAHVTRVHAQRFAGLQITNDDLTAQLKPRSAVAGNSLQQESIAAEDPRPQRLLERDAELNLRCGAEEAVTVNRELVSGADFHGHDVARDLGREANLTGIALRGVF